MKITVENCFSLPSFKDAKVLTSDRLANRDIKRVSVLEATSPEDMREIKKSEGMVLITGFFSMRDDVNRQCQMVNELSRLGVVAIVVVRVGEIVKKIDQKLIDCCENNNIILISIGSSKDFDKSVLIDEMTKLLYYGDSLSIGAGLATNATLEILNFTKYDNFEEAVKGAAIENDFQFVLFSKEFNPVLVVETQQITTIEKAVVVAKEMAVESRENGYSTAEVDGIHTYWGSIQVQGEKHYILIVDNKNKYTVDEMMRLADLVKVSMGVWGYQPAIDKKAEFIRSLQKGHSKKAHILSKEIDFEPDKILSVFLIKEGNEGESQTLIDRYCENMGIAVLKFIENNNVYGVLVGESKDGICTDLYRLLRSNTNSVVAHVIGVGGIQNAIESFSLINEIMPYAIVVFSKKRTLSKYDLTFVRNARKLFVGGGPIKKNYIDFLEPLKINSGAKAQGLIDTLEVFMLDSDMNMKKTAEIMNIHSNTVQYRLKKINSLLGADVVSKRVAPGISMALAITRLEKM
ncbi:MAG: PucR family transcriptional regulator ligand-binding domain-containing protein [Eubacteriales bacterium]|nr:PucR family transcriptional regulator ligand-binding domain-containing protein [Eubacteriales bacterium]MDY3332549.1 PucR family transcriptional regulator ligand-binding domain-containing protein [Gallibacter sp.]